LEEIQEEEEKQEISEQDLKVRVEALSMQDEAE
jgi:hypothetical protein